MMTCQKKEEKTFLSGITVDAYIKQPFPGVDIYIQESRAYPGTGTEYDKRTVGIVKTDLNGKFSYEYIQDASFEYHYIEALKPSDCAGGSRTSGIVSGIKNYYRVDMSCSAWYNIHVKNNTPFNGNDSICYYLSVVPITLTSCGLPIVGSSIDFYDFNSGLGNRYLYIKWFVTKNSIQSVYNDSIYMPCCDTVTYNLFY